MELRKSPQSGETFFYSIIYMGGEYVIFCWVGHIKMHNALILCELERGCVTHYHFLGVKPDIAQSDCYKNKYSINQLKRLLWKDISYMRRMI
jgi:hypothetical protein